MAETKLSTQDLIDACTERLMNLEPGTKAYADCMHTYEVALKAREVYGSEKEFTFKEWLKQINPNTVLVVGTTAFLTIWMLIWEERGNILKTRAQNFMLKLGSFIKF